ncbi:MAG TPA: HAD hydrolase family protein [Acidobacteriota bacterium]|nr:HAD hydrolase family protein [Acidobacteriota bacterium]
MGEKLEIKLDQSTIKCLKEFLQRSNFSSQGGIVTDLDGTSVHEDKGKIFIPAAVELGLKKLYDLGRPFLLNSLRFPLSVLRTFGKEWYSISNAPIPVVSLNGSLFGYVKKSPEGELIFEELGAFPLTASEIDEVLIGVEGLLKNNIKDLLIFYYPRDWRIGEVIWTPVPEKVIPVKEKYVSASAVTAIEFSKLQQEMTSQEICMIFLLIDVPQDTLMAYQHTKRSNFFTHKGVDKLYGAKKLAAKIGINLEDSMGAGDSELDRFLIGVGLSVIVGNPNLDYKGILDTIRLNNSFEFGELLFRLAELQSSMH